MQLCASFWIDPGYSPSAFAKPKKWVNGYIGNEFSMILPFLFSLVDRVSL